MTTLYIKAEMGDSGDSVDEVKVFTNKQLTELTIPPLKDAELELDDVVTESWANIDWEENYVSSYSEDEGWMEDYREFNAPPDEPHVGIAFWSEHNENTYLRATYKELEENLMMRVQENCYEERTQHNGTDSTTVYVYTLNNHLFG